MVGDSSPRPIRFLVTCPARTGSTMLVWFLRSHPELCAHGEVLAPTGPLTFYGVDYRVDPPLDGLLRALRDRDPVGFARDYVWHAGDRRAAGFKGKYEELLRPEYGDLLKYIGDETDIRVIHLWRENLLERYVSEYLAVNVFRVYNVIRGGKPPNEERIRLSPEECRANFERTEHRRARFRSFLAGHRILEVTYEELVGAPTDTLNRVQEFLDVEPRPLETQSVKMRSLSLRETLENHAELVSAFHGTPYARFFHA
jgi:hypothetical protein